MSALPLDALSLADAVSVWASSLPHAILVQALRLLPRDERARCACVCGAWRDAAADPDALASLWFDEDCRSELNDDILARLCARAGAALREVRLDTPACRAVTSAGALAALRQGGCAGVQRLVLRWQRDSDALSAEQAQQLAAACPALEHAACVARCESAEDVAAVCASLPGPLTLRVYGLDAARAASQLPARVAALVLRDCTLDGQCLAAFCDALSTNTTLVTLDLYQAGVDAAGAASLGNALRTNAVLTKLYLSRNNIGDAGAASLANALRTNMSLKTPWLSADNIGDAGAASLANALRTNASLKTLYLSFNRIGAAGAASLGEALRFNAVLTTLDLDDNSGGDEGATALADALRTNATLVTLCLHNNGIGAAGAAALDEVLRTRATLTTRVNYSDSDDDT